MKIVSVLKAAQRIFFPEEKTLGVTAQLRNIKQFHQPAKVIFMPKRETAVSKK